MHEQDTNNILYFLDISDVLKCTVVAQFEKECRAFAFKMHSIGPAELCVWQASWLLKLTSNRIQNN